MSAAHEGVAIVGGTGALGFGLAARWTAAGLPVTIGSRDADRAAESAARLPGGLAAGMANAEAVRSAPVVVLCVPFRSQLETLGDVAGALAEGQIVVDATVPLAAAVSGKATRLLGVWQGSAAEQARDAVPAGVDVVSAFHTISAHALVRRVTEPLDEDVLICGDRKEAKRRVARLIARIPGLRPVDAGRLEMARLVEGLTPLLISANIRHKTHAGVKLTGIPAGYWER